MRFKDWIKNNSNFNIWLFEFMDVADMSTGHINFQRKKGLEATSDEDDYYSVLDGDKNEEDETLTHEFKIGKFNFKVVFEKTPASRVIGGMTFFNRISNTTRQQQEKPDPYPSTDYGLSFNHKTPSDLIFKSIPNLNFWTVDFHGPQGLQTTNQNKNVTFIYKNLLLAIKKLIETETVDVLYFYPAESQMSLIYNKFYNQFLSKYYFRIDTFQFLNKKILEKITNGDYGEEIQKHISNLLSNASKKAEEEFKRIKEDKIKQRQLLKSAPKGKIFQYDTHIDRFVPVMVIGSAWFHGQAHYKVMALYKNGKNTFGSGIDDEIDETQSVITTFLIKPSQLKEPTHPIIINNISKIKSLFARNHEI